MESLEGVIPNFLGFPQPIPTWPRRTLQLFFETFEVADVTPLGFVCLDNKTLIGKKEVDKINRIFTNRTKELFACKIRSKMRITAAHLQSVIYSFVDKKSQLDILNHLSAQLQNADIVKTDTVRKIVKRVNTKPIYQAIYELESQLHAYEFLKLCNRLSSNPHQSVECPATLDYFQPDETTKTILMMIALSEELPSQIHETETFKYLVSDGSFFNRMLTRVAKTELKSKKQSTKAETYLKFMMKRLQL